jgi:predicted ATP-grasp superfamily ATP-dependent carboligase
MTEYQGAHVLIAGVTTRALALSAAKAGYRVTAVDAFGDLDLRTVAEVIPVRGQRESRGGAFAMAIAGELVPASLVAYTSNFENYPDAVALLSQGRCLLGNPPEVLTRIRNPIELSRVLRRHGLVTPETRVTAPGTGSARGSWLVKPRRSGGGHRIKPWSPNRPLPRHSYLQRRIAGIAGSVAFAANGSAAVLLGFSRQLVGDSRLGSHGFRYCGSILGTPGTLLFPRQRELLEKAGSLAATVTREFGLVGLNGIDFIARNGVPYPIEVNPRYSSSMELVERAQDRSMFAVHADACRGILPPAPTPVILLQGKAIVFARRDLRLGDTRPWIGHKWLADIPHPDERIGRGHPICTVLAEARDEKTCYRLLIRRAREVYRFAETRRKRAA